MDKTRLDIQNPQHQLLVSVMATFVDDFGYEPRELFELMNHAQSELWPALNQIADERGTK